MDSVFAIKMESIFHSLECESFVFKIVQIVSKNLKKGVDTLRRPWYYLFRCETKQQRVQKRT